MSEPKATGARASRLIPVLILLIVIALLATVLSACTGSSDETTTSTNSDAAVTTTGSVSSETTSTTESDAIDLGKAEAADGDPALVVETEKYGQGPADQVLILMAEGKGRPEAETVATQLGGTIVGEVEYIGLYQIRTSGTTAEDLVSSIQAAVAFPEVEAAFANGVMATQAAIEGKKCSALRDPLYDGNNSIPYDMVGVQEAWDVIRASGVELNDVHVGMVDSAVNTDSGQGFGEELDVSGLSAGDTTDQPDPGAAKQGGLSHGTQVAHVMGADAEGSGVVGVLGPFGDKVSMTTSNYHSGPGKYQAQNPDPNDITQYQGFFLKTLVEMQKQVKDGATVINMSFGPKMPRPQNQGEAATFRRFFEQMQKDHPKVLFVAAAGNENGALDGVNYGPGGMRLPNVITVGALDQTGDQATLTDWHSPEEIQQSYDERKAAGSIPADWDVEDYTEWLKTKTGSNYATGDGEVTLSACGTGVPTGVDSEGRPILSNGTSFAAPQVAAAAALLKTINPELDADDIKRILMETANSEVEQADGTKVAVPAGMGGKVLRIDKAVLAAINQLRPPNDQLNMQDLLQLATVKLLADGGPGEYTVTASIAKVEGGTDLTISMTGEGSIDGTTSQSLRAPGEVSWTVTPKEGNTPLIKVQRSDTKGCALLTLEGSPFAGTYKGEWTTRAGDLPCEFAVTGDGRVTGKFNYQDPKGATYTFEFTGDVSLSGKLLAVGVVTLNGLAGGKPFIQHTSISLEGQISEAGFIGAWTAETGVSGQVKATPQ